MTTVTSVRAVCKLNSYMHTHQQKADLLVLSYIQIYDCSYYCQYLNIIHSLVDLLNMVHLFCLTLLKNSLIFPSSIYQVITITFMNYMKKWNDLIHDKQLSFLISCLF